MMNWLTTENTGSCAALNDIPEVGYAEFYDDLARRLADARYHLSLIHI